MALVKMFKATRATRLINANQRVFVSFNHANHMDIYFKVRGRGRYVHGVIDKGSSAVGEIKEIEVADDFAERVSGVNPS